MANNRDRNLTEDELLRDADGEIPEKQPSISRHLLDCWGCRARFSDLEAAMKIIVRYRNEEFLAAIPAAPRPWDNLQTRLRSKGKGLSRRCGAACFRQLGVVFVISCISREPMGTGQGLLRGLVRGVARG